MTPVLCESFNNNNNSLNSTGSSVSSCGKMSEYTEYPEYQKHGLTHYTETEHGHPLYPYTEAPGGDVGDGGEGWSEGDECSVDGLGREVYSLWAGHIPGATLPAGTLPTMIPPSLCMRATRIHQRSHMARHLQTRRRERAEERKTCILQPQQS